MKINKQDIKHTIIYYGIMLIIFLLAEDKSSFTDYLLGCTILYIGYFIYKKRGENPRIKQIREEKRKQYKDKRTIVSTKLVPNSTTYRNSGSFTWGFIGSWFYGLRGALLGSYLGGKNKPYKVNFIVYYKDGHSDVESVKINSRKYKEYLKHTK